MGIIELSVPNSILAPSPPSETFRMLRLSDGARVATWDISYVPFLIEDLIAHSAARVAVQAGSLLHEAKDTLPRVLRDRMWDVDKHGEAFERALAVLTPVYKEFKLEPSRGSVTLVRGEGDERAASDLLSLTHDLELFLVGVNHRLQVQVDPARVLATARRLREISRAPDSRANLASLIGLFRMYRQLEAASLQFHADAKPDVIELFSRFVEDETYRAMTHEAGLIGVPSRATYALIRLRRIAADLVRKPHVAETMTLGKETVGAAMAIPVPGPDVLSRLLGKSGYIPPLVSLDHVSGQALAAWRRAAPAFQPPPGLATDYFTAELYDGDEPWVQREDPS